jgi:HAD superfamily hydrolase (TIGR01509 family)
MPGILDLLDHLSREGIPIAVATSAGRQRTFGTLQELGIAHYFQTIVTGDEVAAGKPDPAIYRLAAERMRELPEHLLAVEDGVSGVKAARATGMRCLGLGHAWRASLLHAAGAEPVIPDLRVLSVERLKACFH